MLQILFEYSISWLGFKSVLHSSSNLNTNTSRWGDAYLLKSFTNVSETLGTCDVKNSNSKTKLCSDSCSTGNDIMDHCEMTTRRLRTFQTVQLHEFEI